MMDLTCVLNEYREGYGLLQPFYLDQAVYRAESDAIWRAGWLFAGHSIEAATPGDYFVYDMGNDSIIIARTENGDLAASHNVCRHRASRIITTSGGHTRNFLCPYHQWMYGLDGKLLTCRDMPEDLDKTQWGLKPVAVREMEGLVFIFLSGNPPDFQSAVELMAPMIQPQGFTKARIAHVVDYQVHANWKVVWENNRECYHCDANHPQYVKANFDRYDADQLSPDIQERIQAATLRSQAKWAEAGLVLTHTDAGLFHFPDAEGKIWYSANRTALVDGYLSESMDGQLVALLMGEYSDPDVGTLRLRALPNFWCHASCDHAVTTRLTPDGPGKTNIRVTWLVDEKAQNERDYRLEELLPFWQLTSEQDWEICQNVQHGLESNAYTPGPLSLRKEYNVVSFLNWYIGRMSATSPSHKSTL